MERGAGIELGAGALPRGSGFRKDPFGIRVIPDFSITVVLFNIRHWVVADIEGEKANFFTERSGRY